MKNSIEILRAHGLSKTKVRKKVLDLFLNSKCALSFSAIESSFEKLDRTTLYRTLKTFQSKGIIHRAMDNTSQPKFALCKTTCGEGSQLPNHAHFHCTSCENTYCLDDIPLPEIPNPDRVHSIREIYLILAGTCPKCQSGGEEPGSQIENHNPVE